MLVVMSTETGTVFVTGASRGIGRRIAVHLAEAGRPVVAMARPSADLANLSKQPSGRGITAVEVDVTDPAALAAAFDAGVQATGPPAALITCAGSVGALGPLSEVDPERWWSAVAVDLRGTMLAAQLALRWMKPAGHGRIMTVYGNLGDQGASNLSAFAVAKAGVARLTETMASEVAGSGITILGIHPGFVRTPMTEHLAFSDEGRRWLPGFAAGAEARWGAGQAALLLVDGILAGTADGLSGRILYVGDDLEDLTVRSTEDAGVRRLRLRMQ